MAKAGASNSPRKLDYERSSSTSRFEFGLENERAKMLRRRFLWFTGTVIVLSLLQSPVGAYTMLSSTGLGRWGEILTFTASSLSLLVFMWAFWYAKRRVRAERKIYGLAFWLVVGTGLLSIFSGRGAVELTSRDPFGSASARAGFQVGLAASGEDRRKAVAEAEQQPPSVEIDTTISGIPVQAGLDVDEDGTTATAGLDMEAEAQTTRTLTERQALAVSSLFVTMISVLLTHLLACLFLPWTPREAWHPARVLLGGALLVVLLDVVVGIGGWIYAASALVVMPFTVAPGIAWCWWRHSAFRDKYRVRFVSEQYRLMEQELAGARQVHDSVLPKPRTSGRIRLGYAYEPAREIGGDLIFVHPRRPDPEDPDQPVTAVVLDVAGHGIAAAMTVNRISGELERLFAEHPMIKPDRVIKMLNRYVYLTLARHNAFVTGFAVRADPESETTLEICGAGHPDAFLCRADGKTERIVSQAMMLGVLPPEQYQAESCRYGFDDGDALVLYTDGAAEARDTGGTMLQIDGVCDLAKRVVAGETSVDQWPHQMLRHVAEYRSAPPEDDTLVAVLYHDRFVRKEQVQAPMTLLPSMDTRQILTS
jgi:serine phosphatase RsbU (regulator of sigma subunit)